LTLQVPRLGRICADDGERLPACRAAVAAAAPDDVILHRQVSAAFARQIDAVAAKEGLRWKRALRVHTAAVEKLSTLLRGAG